MGPFYFLDWELKFYNPRGMTRIYILGPAEILKPDGKPDQSFLAGSKRLALLIFLLLSKPKGFHRRDSLLPLFWPEQDQKSARNALSNLLYHIRKTFGNEIILNRGTEEISVNSANIWCDALEFEEFVKTGNFTKALELYRDDLLKGFYVPQISGELELWLDNERMKFLQRATEAAWILSEKAEALKDLKAAQLWTKKAANLNPICEHTHTRVLKTLSRLGDFRGAQLDYDNFVYRLNKDWEEEPPEEITELFKEIMNLKHCSGLSADHFFQNGSQKIDKTEKLKKKIAVLPFETLGKKKASVFTHAIHADILTKLSSISGLHVTSRTSVLKFKSTQMSPTEISKELGVNWILNGEIQEVKNQIQVNIRLVNAFEDQQVWAQKYLRNLSANNIFIIQSEITHKIALALETQLTSTEKNLIDALPTQDLDSYCLHAQGRWNLDQRTEKGMRKAINYFEEALRLDPHYALGWIGLADSWLLLQDYGYEHPDTAIPIAANAAENAFKYSPDLAETYATRALLAYAQRDGKKAVEKLIMALSIRPSYAEAQNWLSWVSLLLGEAARGLICSKKAVELNPLSPEAVSNLSLSLLASGEFSRARREANRAIQLQPEWSTGYFYEGVAHYHLHNYQKTIELLKGLVVLWAGNGPLLTLILAYIKIEKKEQALVLSKQLRGDKGNFSRAIIKAALGEHDKALSLLKSNEYWGYWELLVLHYFYPQELDPIRIHEDFKKIVTKAKLNWKWEK